MVWNHNERKMLEDLILAKLVGRAKVSHTFTLREPDGYPAADSIRKRMAACDWEADILGKLLEKL